MIFQKRKIVENNSHCVRNEVEMELIENMLSAIAAHQFQKEKWFHFDFWSEYNNLFYSYNLRFRSLNRCIPWAR